MIKFNNTEVWGFKHAIRGVRNPLSSWDKSDSKRCCDIEDCSGCIFWSKTRCNHPFSSTDDDIFIIGDKDMELCQRLIKGGAEHRKFLRQIFVSVDITAPLYWWKEFDTYKIGTVANSCSTMHTIHKKEFTLDDFSCEHLYSDELELFKDTIGCLNCWRELYLDSKNKDDWWQMIQLLPSSYNQMRTVTLNYENLRSIYFQRRNHKLDEWREGFVEWVKTLPYAEEFIIFDPDAAMEITMDRKVLQNALAQALAPAT